MKRFRPAREQLEAAAHGGGAWGRTWGTDAVWHTSRACAACAAYAPMHHMMCSMCCSYSMRQRYLTDTHAC